MESGLGGTPQWASRHGPEEPQGQSPRGERVPLVLRLSSLESLLALSGPQFPHRLHGPVALPTWNAIEMLKKGPQNGENTNIQQPPSLSAYSPGTWRARHSFTSRLGGLPPLPR